MTDLLVVGAGSQARYVLEIVRRDGGRRVVGLVDVESGSLVGSVIHGVKVLCTLDGVERAVPPAGCRAVVAYGDPRKKRAIVERLAGLGYRFDTVVSSAAYVSSGVTIGEGSIVNPGATILPDARIGQHAIVHSGCVIEHDNVIGDFANIAPGVAFAGRVHVGTGAFVYTGARVIPGIRIGDFAIVGAGAVVIEDVPAGATVVGCPARVVRP